MDYIQKGYDIQKEHFRVVLSNKQGDKQFHVSVGCHLLNMDIVWRLKQSNYRGFVEVDTPHVKVLSFLLWTHPSFPYYQRFNLWYF